MMLKTFLFLAAGVGMCQHLAAAVQNPPPQPGHRSARSFIVRHSVDDNAAEKGSPNTNTLDTSHRDLVQERLTFLAPSEAPSRAPTIRHSSTIPKRTLPPTEQPTPAPNTAAPSTAAPSTAAPSTAAPNTAAPTISVASPDATTDAPTSNPVVALLDFSFAITTSNDTDTEVDQEILTTTLEAYFNRGMMQAYPDNALGVTLQQRLRRQRQLQRHLLQQRQLHEVSSTIDYSGFVLFSGPRTPPVQDVHNLQQDLMQDTAGLQAALDANPSIGQDVVVENVAFDAIFDNGGDSDGDDDDDDSNGGIIGGVIGGSVLVLAVVALLVTRRRTNSLADLQGASKTANGAAPVDDSNTAGVREQPIAKQQQQTDVDNDNTDQNVDASVAELEKHKATAENQSAFVKNRE